MKAGNRVLEYTLTVQGDGTLQAAAGGLRSRPGRLGAEALDLARPYVENANAGLLWGPDAIRKLGERLYQALFNGPLDGHFFEQAWRRVTEDPAGSTFLRLRLVFQPNVPAHVTSLPWELLYGQDNFLGTHPRVALSCAYDDWASPAREVYGPDELPWRLLFVHTHPADLEGVGVLPVRRAIQELGGDPAGFEELADPSARDLQNKVQGYRPHVLHFLAHGKFLGEGGAFALLDREGKALWYDDQSFSSLFQAWRPGLVVLQACEGGQLSDLRPFSGGAAWLARRHVPAVVALRYPFAQGKGWVFAREFYGRLRQGDPVDVAVQAGRRALATPDGEPAHATCDFAAPVLWMRPGRGRLFPPAGPDDWEPLAARPVLDLEGETRGADEPIRQLARAVLDVLGRHRLERRELRPGDSRSADNEDERRSIKTSLARYQALPEEERSRRPALLHAVGKLEVVAGEFDAARRDFEQVEALVSDPAARAEASHNAYQAALERRQWPEALAALRRAMELDAGRFAPFPPGRYEPERILGAGGFGVAFLCRDRYSGGRVVVKALRPDGPARDAAEVFREARAVEELDHPAVVRLRHCDFAGPDGTRPFLVMDYFDGVTLEEYVRRQGPLPQADLLAVARQVAEGLRAAHGRGVLHRDVKPANVLVRCEGEGGSPPRWHVKVIDFGLALRTEALQDTVRSRQSSGATLVGDTVAGTLDYAAPEQVGRLPGVGVGPYSDVYSFGKTCCYALFRTPQPTLQHWRSVPRPLAELLDRCLAPTPSERPADFGAVLEDLSHVRPQGLPGGSRPALRRRLGSAAAACARLARRRPRLLGGVAAGLVLLAGLAVWLPFRGPAGPPDEPPGEVRRFEGHTEAVRAVAFSPDGLLALSAGNDGSVRLWDVRSGQELRTLLTQRWWMVSAAFSPDGRYAVAGNGGQVRLRDRKPVDNSCTVWMWDVSSGREERRFQKHVGYVFGVAFSPDGKYLLSGSGDRLLLLWDVEAGGEPRQLGWHEDLKNPAVEAWVYGVAFSPDGKRALSGSADRTLRLWEVPGGREVRRFTGHTGAVTGVAFSPSGRQAASASADGTVRLWDAAGNGGELARFEGHAGEVRGVAFSPDGRRVLSGGADSTVRLWDVESGRELVCFTGHTDSVWSVAYSRDGRYALSGSWDNTLRLWRLPR